MRENGLPSEQESRIDWWRRLIFRQRSAPVPLHPILPSDGRQYPEILLLEATPAGSGCGRLKPASCRVRITDDAARYNRFG